MAGIVARSFTHFRRRTESMEVPLTPASELTSWLGDDMCANCGSAVQGSRLYCSDACREQDVQHQHSQDRARHPGGSDAGSPTALKGASVLSAAHAATTSPASRPSQLGSTASSAPAHARLDGRSGLEELKFRYPCPPSPHFLARHKTSALTSPALTALERSMPEASEQDDGADAASTSISSSDDSASRLAGRAPNRRSSSRSTFSSASDNFSTVPSTPSPAVYAQGDEVDDFEPSSLVLPPSVKPASTILLKSASRDKSTVQDSPAPAAQQHPTAPESARISPSLVRKSPSFQSPALHSPSVSSSATSTATMRYARRPSRTNLPPPVLFTSPALTAVQRVAGKSSPADAAFRREQRTIKRKSLTEVENLVGQSSTTSPQKATGRRTSIRADTFTSPIMFARRMSASTAATSDVTISAMPMLTGKSGSKSPEQSLSAASSAGKTLRAVSPQTPTRTWDSVVCGRPGCRGPNANRISHDSNPGSWNPTSSRERRSTVSPEPVVGRPPISQAFGDAHTHSARADLARPTEEPQEPLITPGKPNISARAAKAGLFMTPALAPATLIDSASPRGRDDPSRLARRTREEVEDSDEVQAHGRGRARPSSPPARGRSHARGQSSTARRSPSPKRLNARRGLSQDSFSLQFSVSSTARGSGQLSAERSETSKERGRTSDVRPRQLPRSGSPSAQPPSPDRRGRSPTARQSSVSARRESRRRTSAIRDPIAEPVQDGLDLTKTSSSSMIGSLDSGTPTRPMHSLAEQGYDDVDLELE